MIAKGARGPHYQGRTTQRTSAGKTITERWKGTEAEIHGLEPGIARTYHDTHIERIDGTPCWMLTATKFIGPSGTKETAFSTFDLFHNTAQQSTLYSPVLSGRLASSSITVVEAVYQRIKQEAANTDGYNYTDGIETIDAQIEGVENGRARDLLDDKIAKVATYYEFSYVFRWTAQYNFSTIVPLNFNNYNKYYTSTSAMLSGEGVPQGELTFTLPEAEWLIVPPNVHRSFGGVTEVVRDYWAADVYSRLYYLAVGESV